MKNVAVFRGGTTHEHEHYYSAAEAVFSALRLADRPHRDIVVTKDGSMLVTGRKRTVRQSLEGADVALVLLPSTCASRDTLESYLTLSQTPSIGKRSSVDALSEIGRSNFVTTLPETKEVSVFSIRDYRNQRIYEFPILERISAERSVYNRPTWLSKADRQQISSKLHQQTAGNTHSLQRASFQINGNGVALDNVQTSPDLLFSPALKTSCEFVGLPYKDLINHLIETSV